MRKFILLLASLALVACGGQYERMAQNYRISCEAGNQEDCQNWQDAQIGIEAERVRDNQTAGRVAAGIGMVLLGVAAMAVAGPPPSDVYYYRYQRTTTITTRRY